MNLSIWFLSLCYLLTPGAVMAAMTVCAGGQIWAGAVFAYDVLLGLSLFGSWKVLRSRWLALCSLPFGLHVCQALVLLTPLGFPEGLPVMSLPLLICIPWMAFLVGVGYSLALKSRTLLLLSGMQLLAFPSFWTLDASDVFSHMTWYWLLFGLQGFVLWHSRPRAGLVTHLGFSPTGQGLGGSP